MNQMILPHFKIDLAKASAQLRWLRLEWRFCRLPSIPLKHVIPACGNTNLSAAAESARAGRDGFNQSSRGRLAGYFFLATGFLTAGFAADFGAADFLAAGLALASGFAATALATVFLAAGLAATGFLVVPAIIFLP
ncbi:MAG: hypothetical protein LBU23_01690 [Planctomycetota bacterium]|jgi:hypothetical protein|nr:hypothetical protein [Planctomycetota bacterium]